MQFTGHLKIEIQKNTKMQGIADLALRWAIPTVLGSLFTYLATYLTFIRKQNRVHMQKHEDLENAMFTLIKSQLVGEWSRLTKQQFVYLHDLESVNSLNCKYRQMGGNGMVKLLMADIESLPRKTTKHGDYIKEREKDFDNFMKGQFKE